MKKIMVTQSSMPPYQEYCEEIKDIWESHHLTNNGPKHQRLEEGLCKYLDTDHVSLFTNGHLALYCAIKALNLKGEIITTPFSFVSTTNAIVENNCKPVFCDINPIDYTIDVSKIEALINKRTSAIVPVHVYGNICNVEAIEAIANKHHLRVIYDAAHAFGIRYKGKSVFDYGDINMLSFHATKVFNTIEGGALIYRNKEYYSIFSALKNFGIDSSGCIKEEGINAKMNEFQAAMGLCNLKHIESEISKRKQVAFQYKQLLADIPGINVNQDQENVESNYAYFPVLIHENQYGISAEQLFEKLKEKNIFGRRYFYPLISDFYCYREMGYTSTDTPVADWISKNILCLPMYADLQLSDVNRICGLIRKIHNERQYL